MPLDICQEFNEARVADRAPADGCVWAEHPQRALPLVRCPVPSATQQRELWSARRRLSRLEASGGEVLKTSAARVREAAACDLTEVGEDASLRRLRDATSRVEASATLWNLLGATQFRVAHRLDEPDLLLAALASFEQALERAPQDSRARFNQALTLQRLGHVNAAQERWRSYRDLKPLHGWREIARRHEASILAPGEKGSESRGRERYDVFWDTIFDVARTPVVDQHAGDSMTDLARRLASEWDEQLPARVLAHTMGSSVTDAEQRDALAALDHLRRAMEDIETLRLESGCHAVDDARRLFDSDHPAMALVDLQQSLCAYQRSRYQQARAILTPLSARASSERYRQVAGRAERMLGLLAYFDGDPLAAGRHYRQAREHFQQGGDANQVAALQALEAACHRSLGQRRLAWRSILAAMKTPLDRRTASTAYLLAEEAADLARVSSRSLLSFRFADEVVRAARRFGGSAFVAEALKGRAKHALGVGRIGVALEDLEAARGELLQIDDPEVQAVVRSDIDFVEGLALVVRRPEEALARLDDAIKVIDQSAFVYRYIQARRARAAALKALGRNDEALEDLKGAIAELSRQRQRIAPLQLSVRFLDESASLFDDAVTLARVHGASMDELLEMIGKSRAQVLLHWSRDGAQREEGLDLPAAVSGSSGSDHDPIPLGTVVIEYTVLAEVLLVGVRTASRTRLETVSCPRARLQRLVHDARNEVVSRRRNAKEGPALAALASVLLASIADELSPATRLVIVSHRGLHGVPFALLRNPSTAKLLVNDHPLVLAPSLDVYFAARRRDRLKRGAAVRSTLVVTHPGLPSAVAEGGVVTSTSSKVEIVSGAEVDPATLLQRLGHHELIHFAVHGESNPAYPLLSRLILDGKAKGIYAHQVIDARLQRTRLVILAACASSRGYVSPSEGVVGLPYAFLAAGASAVIASLWDVDDEATAHFFRLFHTEYARTDDPAIALAAVQRAFARSAPDDMATWGAFQVIGGTWSEPRVP